jgi:hypothetical protein
MSSAATRALGVALLGAAVACGPPAPYVRYSGHVATSKAGANPEVYRTNPPPGVRDLGTVVVTCPSDAVSDGFGGADLEGGCGYEWAVWKASHRALEAGADGIHSIETAVNAAGKVVSLHATAFLHVRGEAPTAPKAEGTPAEGASSPQAAPSVEERLRHLEKLKNDGLITPEEYAAKRAEILKDI